MARIDLASKKKLALVLSGGAVKAAAFHMGVALSLEIMGFRFRGGLIDEASDEAINLDPSKTFQVYVGSSAGSLLSTYLAQGGKLKDLVSTFQQSPGTEAIPGLKYWEMLFPRIKSTKDFLSFENFFVRMIRDRKVQSPFGTEGIARWLKHHMIRSDKFSDLDADLFIVATELNSPKKAVFGRYKSAPRSPYLEYRDDVAISDACAASMSLPPVYHPYSIQIKGKRRDYYDGEIIEPLSPHIARDTDCDLIVCSYTHQPVRVKPEQGSLSQKGVQQICVQALYQMLENKIRRAREMRREERELLKIVRRFFKDNGFDKALEDSLVNELEARMTYKSHVDYIHIHPRMTDVEMLEMPSFSLNREATETIVRRGFRAGMGALRSAFR